MMLLKRKTLQKNLILMVLLILMPVILLNAYNFVYWSRYIKSDEIEKDTKFLSLAGQAFDTVLNDITQVVSLLEFDQLLISAMDGLVESDGQLSPSKFMYMNSVWDNTSRTLMAKPYIRSAYFYIEKAGNFVFTTEGIQNMQNIRDKSWLQSYHTQAKDIVYWTEVRKVELPSDQGSGSSMEVVSLFRKFPFLQGQEQSSGVVVINLESKYFDSLVSNIPGIQYKKVYILDDKYSAIYKNSPNPFDTYIDRDSLPELKESSNMIKKVNSEDYLISAVQSKSFDWIYISIIPTKSLLKKLDSMTGINTVICILSLIISIVLSIFYTFKNYRPVKTMVNIISQYNNGKDISSYASGKEDEYGYIIYNMIKAFIDKNEIQKKLTEEKLLQNETRLYALQSQINPHFLYNTLETLNWEAINLLGRDNSISKILLHLAANLRYVTNYSNHLVTVEEDISHLTSYVYIHELINQGRLKILFDIDPRTTSCKTLRLLVQPIVENALIHGLSNIEEGGKVKITVKPHNDTLCIKVVDNGSGISKPVLNNLRQRFDNSSVLESKSLGLNNINQRIRIKFGTQYGVHIRSKRNLGTAVYISLPLIP